jgi:hypothetical protein
VDIATVEHPSFLQDDVYKAVDNVLERLEFLLSRNFGESSHSGFFSKHAAFIPECRYRSTHLYPTTC